MGFSGYGYEIDWDDEPRYFRLPHDCSKDLRHEFHVGGTFEIRANTFHPGLNGGWVYDTRHTAQLVIDSARLESPELPLRLSIAGNERTFPLNEAPQLKYTIHKNRPVYLCVEVRNETGVISSSELIRSGAAPGRGETAGASVAGAVACCTRLS